MLIIFHHALHLRIEGIPFITRFKTPLLLPPGAAAGRIEGIPFITRFKTSSKTWKNSDSSSVGIEGYPFIIRF